MARRGKARRTLVLGEFGVGCHRKDRAGSFSSVVGHCKCSVLRAIPRTFPLTPRRLDPVMGLISSLGNLLVVACLLLVAIAVGVRSLQSLGLSVDDCLEEALYAAGVFFAGLEIALFILGKFGWLRQSVALGLLAVAALASGKGWLKLPEMARASLRLRQTVRRSRITLIVAALVMGCIALDALFIRVYLSV